jgi:transposase
MIPISSSVRIWIATGHTDMRKGMQGLSLLVQESLGRDPFAGDVFVFRGRGGSLIKALWHDGIGLSLYAKRLDRGRFVWPVTVGGVVALSAAQMSYLLEAIDRCAVLLPSRIRLRASPASIPDSGRISRTEIFVRSACRSRLHCHPRTRSQASVPWAVQATRR